MADYRKRLVDMTEEERAEVAPGAPQFGADYDNVDDPMSVQMARTGLAFSPVGAVQGVADIKEELSKEDPNYLKAVGMAAVEAAGLAPMGGPVLKSMMRKGDDIAESTKTAGLADEVDVVLPSTAEEEMISVFPKPERMFPKDARPKGGDYLDPKTGTVLSGRNVSKAKLQISPEGKPSFKVSNDDIESVGSTGKGKTQIKTNLFKKKAGWKWTSAPEGMDGVETLISVQNRGKHYYTVETDFSKGVNLKKYPDAPSEPRLRPTVTGEIELGDSIGTISVRGKEHPVYKSIRAFNEGGLAMDDQMGAMFKSSRTEDVDPVSGNEIPLGSTAEEVRDDIPAQLSEGEYVVPADVVKFFGVKFFEDIRAEAKRGFQAMEANGRIGGEPIDGMEMGGDELPFDISELQVVDDGQSEQPMMNEGGLMTGYADGGSVANMTVPDFLKDYIDKQKETGGIYYETYMSPEGTPMVFAFRDGEAINPIPAGFVLQSEYMAPAAATASVAPQTNANTAIDISDANSPIDIDISKVGTDEDEDTTGLDVDWSTASVEDFKTAQDSLLSKLLPGVAGGASLLGPLGVAASIGIKGSATRKRNNMIRGITERLSGMSNTDSDYSELKKIETSLLADRTKANEDTNLGIIESSGLYGGQSNITENLKDVDESGKVSFGDTWLGDALGFDKDGFGVQGAGLAASVGGIRREEDSESYRALEQVAANKARENKEVEAAIASAQAASQAAASTPVSTYTGYNVGETNTPINIGGQDGSTKIGYNRGVKRGFFD